MARNFSSGKVASTVGSPFAFYLQLSVFFAGFLLVVVLSHIYLRMADDLSARSSRERARLFVGEVIIDSLREIEKSVYQMANTPGVPAQQRIAGIILTRVSKLEHDLSAIEKGGTVRRVASLNVEGADEVVRQVTIPPHDAAQGYVMEVLEIGPHVDRIKAIVSELGELLKQREILRERGAAAPLLSHEREIGRYLKTLPPFFDRVNENANRMFLESSAKLQTLDEQLTADKEKYHLFIDIGIGIVILTVMVSAFLFFRQVNGSNRRLQSALDDMRSARDDARQASSAKSQFLANMSHEIRTPMNGVLGMLDLLIDSSLEESQKRLARIAHGSAEKLLEVINGILDFSKIEAGKLELLHADFDPRETVKDVAELFAVRAREKGIALEYHVDGSVPRLIEGDTHRLRQILVNLVGNAVKFTESGEVALGVRLLEETAADFVLRFQVNDTGPGITRESHACIFEAFCQADDSMARRHEGTGLGLAISRQLVEMMQGEIGVDSEAGKGANFWFTARFGRGGRMPEQDPVAGRPAASGVKAAPGRPLRVLLAEDNPVNQEVGRLILEGLGCSVTVVDDGGLAVEAAFSEEYDLIFMDCQMPVVDGYEATKMIRRREQLVRRGAHRIPIVALTAHAMEGDRNQCLAAGMDDYLSKPFNAVQIAGLLEKWASVESQPLRPA